MQDERSHDAGPTSNEARRADAYKDSTAAEVEAREVGLAPTDIGESTGREEEPPARR